MQKIYLYFSNGLFMEGVSFGAKGTKTLELKYSTSMIGYEDEIFASKFADSALVFSMGEIGTVGVQEDKKPLVEAVIVRNYQAKPSNFLSVISLSDLMTKHNKLCVAGVDTRKIIKDLIENGSLKVVISTDLTTIDELKTKL